jgi:AcrR family transcriptional regulator
LTLAERVFSILNMRSAPDATAFSRIRDAAITLFAAQGYAATTVRQIAAAAEVSPALVIHHFGDKDGLRRECDEHALRVVIAAKHGVRGDVRQAFAEYVRDPPPHLPPPGYFARMVMDGTPEGERFFDRIVDETRQAIDHGMGPVRFRQVPDPDALAALLTAYSFAILILERHVARHFGAEPDDPDLRIRLAAAAYDLYTRPLLETPEGTPT